MLNASPASPSDCDLETPLEDELVIKSRVTKMNEDQKVPQEVLAAGCHAVDEYLRFVSRVGDAAVSPFVENIEVESIEAADRAEEV